MAMFGDAEEITYFLGERESAGLIWPQQARREVRGLGDLWSVELVSAALGELGEDLLERPERPARRSPQETAVEGHDDRDEDEVSRWRGVPRAGRRPARLSEPGDRARRPRRSRGSSGR